MRDPPAPRNSRRVAGSARRSLSYSHAMRYRLALLCALTLVACDDGETPDPPDAGDAGEAPPADAGGASFRAECENINATHCLLPWPSDRYRGDDGMLALEADAMPTNDFGDAVDARVYDRFDGFSPAGSMVTSFEGELDASGLNGELAIGDSLDPGSTTVIVDAETGELVAHWAELDEWPSTDPARAALYIRPAARLAEGRRYVVGIQGLQHADGSAVEPSTYFRALRDAEGLEGTDVAERQARFDSDVFAVLEGAGVSRDGLIEAWDFTTADGENLWGEMISMRDDALEAVGDEGLGCTVLQVLDADEGDEVPDNTWRQVIGTVTVPLFLNGDQPSHEESTMNRGPDGMPAQNGTAEVPFIATIPPSVRDAVLAGEGPARVEVYGHGLFGSRLEITYGWHREHQERLGVVSVAVDWWGMSENDLSRITQTLQDFSMFTSTADRLRQATINFLVLGRSFRGVCAELPEMQVPMPDGSTAPAADAAQTYYYGNSQGGIFSGAMVATATDWTDFVLGVGGMSFPLIIKRSSAWVMYSAVMEVGYGDALERDLLLTMSSSFWDLAGPATYSPHFLTDPLPGSPVKRVLMQVGINDALVNNAATYVQARTAGVPLITPSPYEPYGVDTTTAPADSGLVIWEIPDVPPHTPGTRSPTDNATHEAVRRTDSARDMIDAFTAPGGQITQTCDGPCDPE